MSGLALGTLVYAATGSPLLSALGMFGPSLAQLIGATALLSAADRLPPRAAMTGLALAFGLGTAALAVPGLPVWAIFAIVLAQGLVASLGGGVRYGLLNEILPPGRLPARPLGAQHVGRRHADLRVRGRRRARGRPVAARRAAGRRGPVPGSRRSSPGSA